MASSSMLIITPLLAVASLSLIVCSLPYDNKTHQDIQHQQRPNVAAVTAEKRTDKPYYSQLKFAISLLDSLQKNEPNKNIFYSPHSVYHALLLAYSGAAGETEKELKHILGLDWAETKADVEYLYKLERNVRANRFQNPSIEFNSVDKLYVSKDIKIK